jgi:hypothetical protein
MVNSDTIWELIPESRVTAVVVANAVPIVGLVGFDTSGTGLLVFYWLEFTVLSLWALVRAVFSGKPRESDADHPTIGDHIDGDAGIPIPWTSVTIRYRTIPALIVIVPLLAVVWAGFGGVVVGPVVAANPGAEPPQWVIAGTVTVFATEGGRTAVEYFYRGEYRNATVWMPVQGLFWQGLVLVGAGLAIVLIAREFAEGNSVTLEEAASGPMLALVVFGKFAVDLTAYYLSDRDRPLVN